MGFQERKRKKRIKEYVIIRDGLTCCYCNSTLTLDTVTLDHIVPYSKRGTYNATNLTVSCASCNSRRGNIPFFEFCQQFNFTEEKLFKYKILYYNNLKIKILNVAKEECLISQEALPIDIIRQACSILKIKMVDLHEYEKLINFEINFQQSYERKKIKFYFEQLIRLLEFFSS